ncbi:MAG: lipoyl synthase [Chloroflexi bacterium]|nr:lipoyl synthase [Chloroflexota bacterium]
MSNETPVRPRHPEWLKVRAPWGEDYSRLRQMFRELQLHTVCEEAICPNIGECWGAGTATIMILGEVCTRACRFCAVTTGDPGGIADQLEPWRVSDAIAKMGLSYVVITSVDRDDLPDEGAGIFADTIRHVRAKAPQTIVEVLIPDFKGKRDLLQQVVEARPAVIAQNIETVRRLTHDVRDKRAGYDQTLRVLRAVKAMEPAMKTKSSIMLGLGETYDEVVETMRDLRGAGCDLLAIGQYLRPTDKRRHYPMMEYVHPDVFARLREDGLRLGFLYVASGPLVRSSYKAWEAARLFPNGAPA